MGDNNSKTNWTVVNIIVVFILIGIAVIVSWPAKPKITCINPVKISHLDDGSPYVDLQLKIHNPSNLDINIRKIALNIQHLESGSKLKMGFKSINAWDDENTLLEEVKRGMDEIGSFELGNTSSMLLNVTFDSVKRSDRNFNFLQKGTFNFEISVWTIEGKNPNFILPFKIEVDDKVLKDLKNNLEQGAGKMRITRKFECFARGT